MKAFLLTSIVLIICPFILLSQQLSNVAENEPVKIYSIKPAVDIPVFIGAGGLAAFCFKKIGDKPVSTEAQIAALKQSDVNGFDRWAIEPYDEKKDNLSYKPFYVSMPAPLILFALDRKMRKDFLKLTFLYGEAVMITGALYGSAAAFTNRYRPMVYSAETIMAKRLSGQQKKSFFAGHVALVGTSCFFMARVIADYHPESRYKWVFYTLAGLTTAGTGYLRIAAGEHFPTDVLLGTAVGTLSGLLTPVLHRTKLFKSQRLALVPASSSGMGLTAFYKL